MGEWRGRRRGRGGGGKGGGRCYNRGTASTAASWFYPQTDKIWIPSHCRSLDRRGQSCTLGNPAGSHPSDTDGRMSQAATPPCLGPHLRVPNPGLPAVPTAHRPPRTWSAPLLLSQKTRAGGPKEVSGRALATFSETPPRPSFSQTSDSLSREPGHPGTPHCPMLHGGSRLGLGNLWGPGRS